MPTKEIIPSDPEKWGHIAQSFLSVKKENPSRHPSPGVQQKSGFALLPRAKEAGEGPIDTSILPFLEAEKTPRKRNKDDNKSLLQIRPSTYFLKPN